MLPLLKGSASRLPRLLPVPPFVQPSIAVGADMDPINACEGLVPATRGAATVDPLLPETTKGVSAIEPLLAVDVNGDGSMTVPLFGVIARVVVSNRMEPRLPLKLPLLHPPPTCSTDRFSI